jgi:hypothetical protein
MKRFALAFRLSFIALGLFAGAVRAQAPTPVGVLDHLMCYKMVDPLQIRAAVTMFSDVQPQFSQRQCTLVKPVEFCVPATKTTVTPPLTTPNLIGQPLQNDYICYLVKCAGSPSPPNENVTDQFGTRTQQKYQPFTICAPARKAPTTCHQATLGSSSTRAPVCGGTCPNAGDKCAIDPADKGCKCLPAIPCQGSPDARGVCGGTCPDATQVCVSVVPAGTNRALCECTPPPPPLCSKDAAGVCGGTCPNAAQTCLPDTAGNCLCQQVTQGCIQNSAGACSGACADPTQRCVLGANGCTCQGAQCGPTVDPLTGTCGGPCPPGLSCAQLPGTSQCQCQPSGCSSDPLTGACGGTCPQGQCGLNPSTNSCQCLPLTPCAATGGSAVCGGVCPAFGQTCALVAVTGQCACQPTTVPTCGLSTAGTCGGSCPTGTCQFIGNVCGCQ